jgi:hypothetical protein
MKGYMREVINDTEGLIIFQTSFSYTFMFNFSVLGISQQGLQEFVIFPYFFRY